jgi:hypothetical protein
MIVAGCGEDAISSTSGTGGGTTGSGGQGVGGNAGAGTTVNQAVSNASTASDTSSTDATDSTDASTGSTMPMTCENQQCGASCVVCDDQECLDGFCDHDGMCAEASPPDCEHTLCYTPNSGDDCAEPDQAKGVVCECADACALFGEIVSGPTEVNGECCYQVIGECTPIPN